MVYHGYENGFRTLGRQCLLEPIEWTRTAGSKPRAATCPHRCRCQRKARQSTQFAKSDDFKTLRFGVQ
jgi:xylan 1,4-beta-xylosidase